MPDLDKHRMLGLYLAEKPVWPSSHLNPDHPGTPKARNPQARAGVAQLVERKALNLVVKGSSPFFGDIHVPFVGQLGCTVACSTGIS